MIISINWIKEFVNLEKRDPNDLGKRFTLATCEVENVITVNEHLKKVMIVEILKTEPHPDADKLKLVTINTGSEKKVIVCGAPNARVGIKVPFAPIGSTLPNGLTLDARKVRGILSEGMLCGEDELGIGSDTSGLKEFPVDAPIGTSLSNYLKMPTDILFDIDNKSITNRPDLWAHYGMAREFAAVFNQKLENPFNAEWEKSLLEKIPNDKSPIMHKLIGQSACKGYFGLTIENIKVEESPSWIQHRLLACGLRPINSIVDVSNYVLLELGIPNHIFDIKKIRGNKIEVKRPTEEIKMITLDEQERKIEPTDTLIYDEEGPIAIAGIMGGLDSSVTNETTAIFIECANFIDVEIRKTATRLGLRTDSSQRYEKALDSHLLKRTALRLMDLILELNPGAKIKGSLNYEGENLSSPNSKIEIEPSKISKVLGKEISKSKIIEILQNLDFKIKENKNTLSVTIPTYRATKDIEVEADIIEEIGRIIGYDNIEAKAPKAIVEPVSFSSEKKLNRKISDYMVLNRKALEIMTYPMIGESLLEKCEWDKKNKELELVNALSQDTSRMRPSLIPSILQTIQLNSKNENSFILFEQGRTYLPSKENFSIEENHLIVAFFNKKENTIMDAINCTEELFSYLNLSGKIIEQPSNKTFPKNWIGLHPNEHLTIQVFGKEAGAILSIHPLLKSKLKIKGNLSLLDLNLSSFESNKLKPKNQYKPLPKFPGSDFDCTVIIKKGQKAAETLKPIKKLKIKEIVDIKIVDIFNLNEKENSITLRTHFIDKEKTLNGKFLEESKNKIIESLEKSGYPLKQ